MGGPQSLGSLTQTLFRPPRRRPPAPLHKPLHPEPPGPSSSTRNPSPELSSPLLAKPGSFLEKNLKNLRGNTTCNPVTLTNPFPHFQH